MSYRYTIDQTADEVLARLPRREATGLRGLFRVLAEHPFTAGLQRVTDNDGRACEVVAHDRFVVTYRADHAGREMRIVAVEVG
jgi:hypothetical protein